MNQHLRQRMSQEMQLLPKMLQSLEVLQLAQGELDTFLERAALENEALQFSEAAPTQAGPRGTREDADRHGAWLESQAEPEEGLVEVLEREVALLELPESELAWVRLVVSCLDPRGYLSVPDERLLALAVEQGLPEDPGALGRAIAVVQSLEPRGIGGRDVVEALLLQLDPGDEDYGLLCRLLEEFLEDVAKNKLPAVAKALGLEVERLKVLLARLRELDPVPGAALGVRSSPVLRPDVVVEEVEPDAEESSGERAARRDYRVRVEHARFDAVTLDDEVQRLAKDPAQPAGIRRYLRDKVDRARWLLDSIEQRKRTLLSVAVWVFDRQRGFLERGPAALRPLTMTDAAADLGVHLSTVSRAVAGKHVSTPFGVHPLRAFFQSAAGDNEGVSKSRVHEALRSAVDGEDPEKPLSDDELCRHLEREGFQVARRTIAKYRRELGIQSSYRRRRY